MKPTTKLQILHFFFFFIIIIINHLSLTNAKNIFLNCGSSTDSIDLNGHEWTADSKIIPFEQSNTTSIVSKSINFPSSIDPVPYLTARIFQSRFTYYFPVTPGQIFLRLFFNPTTYHGFQSSSAFFTVTAGPFTLLTNFSPFNSHSLGLKTLEKEFCLSIERNQVLNLTFSPSSAHSGCFAFVNGIQIISMPTNLYYKPRARRIRNGFALGNTTTLETMHRLNIGGSFISPANDSGLYRTWLEDKAYSGDGRVVDSSVRIRYSKIAPYVAPAKVYQTARYAANEHNNTISWNLSVDSGFTYLVRLHLCELTKRGRTKFAARIGNGKNVITWSGGKGIAVYRDYVVKMPSIGNYGRIDLLISLGNSNVFSAFNTDPILNGMEVFKLSDSRGNLSRQNRVSNIEPIPNRTGRKLLFIIGGVVLAAFTLILLLSLTVFVLRRKESNEKDKPVGLRGRCRRFTLEEIRVATQDFDRALVIGNGGFGRVFKGCIDGGTPVAIKALKPTSTQGSKEFEAEIEMLSDLRHKHLVSLIGCCDYECAKIIVYEYMPRGTLRDHLYSTEGPPLSWKQRLEIGIGVARGLKYLHGENPKIIHRDIKPSNILLDENLAAKVSDFGLSRFGPTSLSRSDVTTGVKGTFGYVDPDYFETSRLSVKSDVYSFGVILLEMLCARQAVDSRLDDEQQNLAEWVRHCNKVGKLKQIMDPNLKGQISPGCWKTYLCIALKCLNNDRHKRPTMAAVLRKLKHALELQECTDAASDEEVIDNNDMEIFLKPNRNPKVIHSCPTFWNKPIVHKEMLRFLSDKAGLKWSTTPSLCGGLKTFCSDVPSYGTLSGDGLISNSSDFRDPILLDSNETFKL